MTPRSCSAPPSWAGCSACSSPVRVRAVDNVSLILTLTLP